MKSILRALRSIDVPGQLLLGIAIGIVLLRVIFVDIYHVRTVKKMLDSQTQIIELEKSTIRPSTMPATLPSPLIIVLPQSQQQVEMITHANAVREAGKLMRLEIETKAANGGIVRPENDAEAMATLQAEIKRLRKPATAPINRAIK